MVMPYRAWPRTMSRRDLLRVSCSVMIGAAGAALAACGPSAPPTPTPKPSQPQPAAAPTAARAAAPPASAAAATPAPAAAATKPGRELIGKLEGPTIVTDSAQFPKKFAEAPPLAELVKQGKLPPVDQRLPEEPLVIQP